MPGQAGNSLPIKKNRYQPFPLEESFHTAYGYGRKHILQSRYLLGDEPFERLGSKCLGAVTGRDMNGVQISGISNMVGGSMRGVQVAGITNINGNNLSGLSVSGLVGITGNHARGMVFSGLANITDDNSNGVIVGGLLNITGEKTAGVQLSGLANISGGNFPVSPCPDC